MDVDREEAALMDEEKDREKSIFLPAEEVRKEDMAIDAVVAGAGTSALSTTSFWAFVLFFSSLGICLL